MKNNSSIVIRDYKQEDAPFLASIYYNTIHHVNAKDYSAEQLEAWAPISSLEAEGWIKKWENLPPIVAILDEQIVGFAELEDNGHIDCFYCHHDYQGRGVGSAMMKDIEIMASRKMVKVLFAEVSIIGMQCKIYQRNQLIRMVCFDNNHSIMS